MSSEYPNCPHCGSGNVKKNGYNSNMSRKYKCKNCLLGFSDRSTSGFTYERKLVRKKLGHILPFSDCPEQLKRWNRTINVDSIIDTPCMKLSCICKRFCDVNHCPFLESWLQKMVND